MNKGRLDIALSWDYLVKNLVSHICKHANPVEIAAWMSQPPFRHAKGIATHGFIKIEPPEPFEGGTRHQVPEWQSAPHMDYPDTHSIYHSGVWFRERISG